MRGLPILPFLVLAGCGGGSGGGIAAGSAPSPSATAAKAELPEVDLTVVRTAGAWSSGSAATWHVTGAGSAVAQLEAFVGTDWREPVAAVVTADGTAAWTVRATLPAPLPPDSALLLRATFADGGIVESGAGALRP